MHDMPNKPLRLVNLSLPIRLADNLLKTKKEYKNLKKK